jgi:hypothetical protein
MEDIVKIILLIATILVVIIIVAFALYLSHFNKKVNSIEENIDINISKRYDLLVRIRQNLTNNGIDPHLLNTMFLGVKKDFDTTNIVLFDLKGKSILSSQMSNVIRNLSILPESFPQLMSDSKYGELVLGLKECEDDYKKVYHIFTNEAKHLNNLIKNPLGKVLAKILRIKRRLVN